jgi:hypothetical protein
MEMLAMNILNILRKLGRLFPQVRKPARKSALHGFKPCLEMLEDRLAPANVTWTGGGANNLWTNPNNWNAGVPGADDVAIIATNTRVCEITANVTVAGLKVGLPAQTGTVVVRTAANNPITVTINGNLSVFAPEGRSSTLTIGVTATFNVAGEITVNGATTSTLNVRGTLTTPRTITIDSQASVVLVVNATARANVRSCGQQLGVLGNLAP